MHPIVDNLLIHHRKGDQTKLCSNRNQREFDEKAERGLECISTDEETPSL